jgi:hypothetical protein
MRKHPLAEARVRVPYALPARRLASRAAATNSTILTTRWRLADADGRSLVVERVLQSAGLGQNNLSPTAGAFHRQRALT